MIDWTAKNYIEIVLDRPVVDIKTQSTRTEIGTNIGTVWV
jgi:hypothetical protein